MLPCARILRKVLVFLDNGKHNALVIFAVKRSNIPEISKKLLNDIFVEYDEKHSFAFNK